MVTPEQQLELLIRIDENVKALTKKMDEYTQECTECKDRMRIIELDLKGIRSASGVIGGVTAIVVSFISALVVAFLTRHAK